MGTFAVGRRQKKTTESKCRERRNRSNASHSFQEKGPLIERRGGGRAGGSMTDQGRGREGKGRRRDKEALCEGRRDEKCSLALLSLRRLHQDSHNELSC